jgi:hypothetical protein
MNMEYSLCVVRMLVVVEEDDVMLPTQSSFNILSLLKRIDLPQSHVLI